MVRLQIQSRYPFGGLPVLGTHGARSMGDEHDANPQKGQPES
jgi:hypothetical protein